MKIILWSEFPRRVNWKKVKALFSKHKLRAEIYVACKNLFEFKKWKRKISYKNIRVGAWPILSKQEGYWFSGFSSKRSIDKLKEFSGQKLKIDLEVPFSKWQYSDWQAFLYFLKILFRKGKNNEYLKKTIKQLSKTSEIIVNEFPFPELFLKRAGLHYSQNKKVIKNIMLYTTIPSKVLQPFVKWNLKRFAQKAIKKDRKVTFSIGLIGKGILKTEGIYTNIKEFQKDLDFIKSLKAKAVAIYSIEAIMERDSEKWINLISKYQK
ncbi:hypothetical protein B6U80_01005 [Candidatus Pacearchaeota archaeon ex4484_26]|nr:MAG: hypothetical protein B6U80_01005 [Candidatus Pacearchaeota archaeon ex4484_26]